MLEELFILRAEKENMELSSKRLQNILSDYKTCCLLLYLSMLFSIFGTDCSLKQLVQFNIYNLTGISRRATRLTEISMHTFKSYHFFGSTAFHLLPGITSSIQKVIWEYFLIIFLLFIWEFHFMHPKTLTSLSPQVWLPNLVTFPLTP